MLTLVHPREREIKRPGRALSDDIHESLPTGSSLYFQRKVFSVVSTANLGVTCLLVAQLQRLRWVSRPRTALSICSRVL